MGSKHGRRVTFPLSPDALDLQHRPLKSSAAVSEFLEETINRIRQGTFDLRAANTIGFLAGILLKGLDQGPARISAEARADVTSQLYAKRLYLPDWRKEAIEKIQRAEREQSGT